MSNPSRPLFEPLPPHVDAADPRTLAWEIARTQAAVSEHADRLQAIEDRPHLPELIVERLPWLRLVAVVVCGLLFAAGLISREEAKGIAMKLFGVLSGG